MKMSRCVPNWDFMENNSVSPKRADNVHPISESAARVPKLDYEAVTELTWKYGQPGMTVPAASPAKYAAWDWPRAGGTLASVVDQATKSGADGGRVPLLDPRRVAVATDAMVPCNNSISSNNNSNNNILYKNAVSQLGCGPCGVGSCSGARPEACQCGGASDSATCGAAGRESHLVTVDSGNYREREFGTGASWSTSLFSPANTSSAGGEYERTSPEDHDSFCRSRSQREGADDYKRRGGNSKPLSVSKQSRAAAIHNRSERKRRDKINQKMKTLQKMVPNASKTDKASMLDEVIEYLKQLQAQVQFMMSRMNMSSMNMMLPSLAMQQQLQMSMMAPAMGLGMGHVMDMGAMSRAVGLPPFIPTAGGFLPPIPSWEIQGGDRPTMPPGLMSPDMLSAFLACHQSQPLTIDAYSKLQAALYQQLQQPPAPDSKN